MSDKDAAAAAYHDDPENRRLEGAPRKRKRQEDPPRTGLEIQAAAIQATCGQCWAYPNRRCRAGADELHFARYERANVKSVVTDDELERARAFIGEGNYVTWGEEPDAGKA